MKYSYFHLLFFTLIFSQLHAASDPDKGPKLGLQSWTCRNMSFEEAVLFAKDNAIHNVAFFSKHLNPADSVKVNLAKKKFLRKHGIKAYTIYFGETTADKSENRKLFELGLLFDMEMIVVEPKHPSQWDNLEELAVEYDIKLGIHNHGIESTYGNPLTIQKILAERDQRIGVCLDVGWVTAAGFDAAKVFKNYGTRVFDIHFKDKTPTTKGDNESFVDTELGRGATNFRGLFSEIKKSEWNGVMAIETDSNEFAENPVPFVLKAKKFFNSQTRYNGR